MTAGIQKGTTVLLGLNSYTYTLLITEDAALSPIADVQVIKSEDNDTTTVVIFDPGTKLSLSGIIKGTVVPTVLLIGSSLAINSVTYRIEKYDLKFGRTEAKLSVDLIKEASMTYT